MTFERMVERAKEEWRKVEEGPTVFVGAATCGRSAGAMRVLEAAREELEKEGVEANLVETGCLGLCYTEPIVSLTKPGRPRLWYGPVSPERAGELIRQFFVGEEIPKENLLGRTGEGEAEGVWELFDLPMLKPQVRRILYNCGITDPVNLDHYLARGGYRALRRALFEMTPEKIIEEVKRSGLRGLGGAGFLAGEKWESCREAKGEEKFVICNADEGDPGAFQDRSVLEGDPFSVLEGMTIAGYAIEARKGFVYVRAEYPLAVKRLEEAITKAREWGFLGRNILGRGFDFEVEIFQGAGAFVCGEETALIRSIEGRRGMPRHRPPYPAQEGLWGKPTLINNVKTLASVRWVVEKRAEWFASTGTGGSKGTAVFSLAGKVARNGLIEVPMGIRLREIVYDIGGGIGGGKEFKAVQIGGPSGGCLPCSLLDTPVDFDSLTAAGGMMGSGGIVVADEDTCMVELARYFLEFTQRESCGQCPLCRLGTLQMLEILQRITEGRGREEDLELLEEIGKAVKIGSLCGLGRTAPNPVLTTLRYFGAEYEEHIKHKRCPARVCRKIRRRH